ncbi:hypothetical protein GGR56DRAFT_675045 [Xylariaceae sp. FL0804]|nr:hypothetical protein GGR56DRAFT_675045 [Xylariaceae sp. FL0804]
MSANRNTESMAQKGEEFSSRVPPSEPLTTKGHAPGVLVGNEAKPEFHLEKHPAGTAPRDGRTHEPDASGELSAQALGTQPSAADTLPGATSADVHTGLGKPLQGQEEREKKGAHPHGRKKEGTGLAGVGAASVGVDSVRAKGADLPEGVEKGTRGKGSDEYPAAEERPPVNAEQLASERKVPDRAHDYTQSNK